MEVADVREWRQLRQENTRLKKVLAERDLEVEVMKEWQANKWSALGRCGEWRSARSGASAEPKGFCGVADGG